LHDRTTVIYLRSSPEELYRRLRHDTQRPLLQVADPQAKLRELYEQRHPLYEEVAHYSVDTGRPSVATLVNMILMQLEVAGLLPPVVQAPANTSSKTG
jgi:shikimate kinase